MLTRFPIYATLLLFFSGITGSLDDRPGGFFGDATIYAQPDSVIASVLYQQARLFYFAGKMDYAFDRATASLHYAMSSNQVDTEKAVLHLLADISLAEDLPGNAIPYLLRAANILELEQDKQGLAALFGRMAGLYEQEEVYEKSGEYYFRAYELTDENDYSARIRLMENVGLSVLYTGEADSAAVCFDRLILLIQESGLDDTRARYYLVQAYNQGGRHDRALRVNEFLFNRFSATNDYRRMSAVRNNMGFNYTYLQQYTEAAGAFREAVLYGERAGLPASEMAILEKNAGIAHQNSGERAEAIKTFSQAVVHMQESGMMAEKSETENILSLMYYHQGDLYNAGLFSRSAIESAEAAGEPERLSEAYLTYSRVLREGNDPINALEYYEKYLNIRDSVELERKLREQALAGRKYELEKSEKELKLRLKEEEVRELAIRQLTLQLEKEEQEKELLKREKDLEQLEKERLRQSLEIARQNHEAEQRERENRLLEQENRIKDLRIEQEQQKQQAQEQEIALLEQQKQLDELELERQRIARRTMVRIIVLVVLISLLILAGLINTRRKNELLARQKQEIQEKNADLEQKNEEIISQRDEIEAQRNLLMEQKEHIQEIYSELTKSIEYAQRIQSSTLPDMAALTFLFPEHFLLFRPRDIVSGDFYWVGPLKGATVITVVDCTGHGVPGAFMSMLGMTLLKEIVLKEMVTQPSEILRRMRKEVITALGQKGSSGEQRDGMDLSLVTLRHDTGMLEYAGAYNSVYIIRNKDLPPPDSNRLQMIKPENGQDVLYEINADKMPIALYERMEKFNTHEIPLFEGDRVYLFSDGYADQFGGNEGKKFMYKPFKRLLLGIASEPMKRQKEILETTLSEWMGDMEQIDDICVLGFAIGTVGSTAGNK